MALITQLTSDGILYRITIYDSLKVLWIDYNIKYFHFTFKFDEENNPTFIRDNSVGSSLKEHNIPANVFELCKKYLKNRAFI